MRITLVFFYLGLSCLSLRVNAKDYSFDAALVEGVHSQSDLDLFSQGKQLPGTYLVDVEVNGMRVESRDVTFFQARNEQGEYSLKPCLTLDDLFRYGIKEDKLQPIQSITGGCVDLSHIPGVSTVLNFNSQSLIINIPQIYLRRKLDGIAPETMWNDGIPALLLGWQANILRNETGGEHRSETATSSYVQMTPGINMGPWRLRNSTTWQRSGNQPGHWESSYTYLERGLNKLKSRLIFGDSGTPADIFDSVPFRGVMLNSDENMVPPGEFSYSPSVSGIARTQARVDVSQNGYILYSGTVAPGPFKLDDLVPSSSGGDLQVTVHESDGSIQFFTVPYQNFAIALREGYLKYSLMAGQYRPVGYQIDSTPVVQATAMYGLPLNLTAYAGAQRAQSYTAGTLGLGMLLGRFGAISVDGTESISQKKSIIRNSDSDSEQGQAWRLRYSQSISETDTSISLLGYQYRSAGYKTLSEALDTWNKDNLSIFQDMTAAKKSRMSISVRQGMGAYGALSLTGNRDTWYGHSGHSYGLNAGYYLMLRSAMISLNLAENNIVNTAGKVTSDRITSLWISIPLGRWLGGDTMSSYSYSSSSNGGGSYNMGLNGSAFDRRLRWGVREQLTPGSENDSNNALLNMDWSGTYGQIGGSYNYSPSIRQFGANASGSVVIHSKGVTFGQRIDDTIALVEAPGVSGVAVGGWPGVRTDFRGYTVLGGITPYQENIVTLDSSSLPSDAEITRTDMKVVPTKGAVVPARFSTRIGGRSLMTLTQAGGEPIPFGSIVTLNGENLTAGITGKDGLVYLTGLPTKGSLTVKWSKGTCQVTYSLPSKPNAVGLYEEHSVCR